MHPGHKEFLNRGRNTMFIRSLLVGLVGVVSILGFSGYAEAEIISIALTAGELGFSDSNINEGDTVDGDKDGLITSPTTGEGSILTIQKNGDAGPGTVSPLLVTLTAQTHLDVIYNLPTTHDYHAGVIFITDNDGKDKKKPGEKRGLGVRAFEVNGDKQDPNFLMRTYASGAAEIDGSKEVSGGTDFTDLDAKINAGKLNSPPHVDESVIFDFDPWFNVKATSVKVIFEDFKFDPTGKIALDIKFTNRGPLAFPLLETSGATITAFTELDSGLKRWRLDFDQLPGLGTNDFVDYFEIRSLDDLTGGKTAETAQHFLINGLTLDAQPVPTPSTLIGLVSMGAMGLILAWRRRRRR